MKTLFASVALALSAIASASAEPLRIGVVLPLSGPNAQFGINSKNGIELALDGINASRAEADKVELVYSDAPAPNAAPAAVQRLVSQNKVVGILGSFVSSITLASSEVAERLGIPMITHSFADQITGRGYRFIFQVSPKATTIGEKQFNYAVDLAKLAGTDISRIAILYEDTAYGTAQAEGIRKAAAKAGVQVVIDEAYPLGITDVGPLINKLRRSPAQMVFPVSYFNDGVLIIRTMKQQKIDLPIIGGAAGYVLPEFQTALGPHAEDVFSIAPANYDGAPRVNARYKGRHGAFMPHEALMYGAALEHMVAAADKAGSRDPKKIRDAIAALRRCDGFAAGLPGGCTAFAENGLSLTAYPIFVQWRGTELVTVYPRVNATQRGRWLGREVR